MSREWAVFCSLHGRPEASTLTGKHAFSTFLSTTIFRVSTTLFQRPCYNFSTSEASEGLFSQCVESTALIRCKLSPRGLSPLPGQDGLRHTRPMALTAVSRITRGQSRSSLSPHGNDKVWIRSDDPTSEPCGHPILGLVTLQANMRLSGSGI